ncbi:MAG: Flp pilus assembly protein CpaB [Betaproteobacteria bacterium]|jgi:pilus assembly protein CpaB
MKSRGLWMLLIAGLAGLAAVVLAARWMQGQGTEQGRIAVANADIELGGRISSEMVRLTDWPKDSVPQGAFSDPSRLNGRVVLVALQRGEPLTEARLAPVGARGGLSAVVPEGRRAMTVRVNDVVGVAGFALPGTYVDVMVNTQSDGAQRGDRDRSISKIVLERILVLAVAQEADRDSTKPKVVNAVTLEVTPRDAEVLDLARSVGTLSLVLRNHADPISTPTTGATKSELLGPARAEPPPKPPAPPARMVRVAKPLPPPPAPATRSPAPETVVAEGGKPAAPRACVDIVRGLTKVTECF